MPSTSLMFLPRSWYVSTSGVNRLPSHSSQTEATPAIIARSVYTSPRPLHLGQAPSEFALNSAALTPLALAKAVRIGPSSPVYVAGLDRREPRIGDWSATTTPSRPAR